MKIPDREFLKVLHRETGKWDAKGVCTVLHCLPEVTLIQGWSLESGEESTR